MKQFIIKVGDINNGYTFVGPFNSRTEAIEYATSFYKKETWTTCPLIEPILSFT